MLVELLKPFQQATTVMGAVRYPTLSTVKLKITDGESGTSRVVKEDIKKDLEDMYNETAVERIYKELLTASKKFWNR